MRKRLVRLALAVCVLLGMVMAVPGVLPGAGAETMPAITEGVFFLRNAESGYYLDLSNMWATNGNNVGTWYSQYSGAYVDAQMWILNRSVGTTSLSGHA